MDEADNNKNLIRDKIKEVTSKQTAVIADLKLKLQDEVNRSTRIKANAARAISKLRREILDLKKETNKRSKEEIANDDLTNAENSTVDLELMKNLAFSKAKIESLEEDLKHEISNSSKFFADNEVKQTRLKEELVIEKRKSEEEKMRAKLIQDELDQARSQGQTALSEKVKNISQLEKEILDLGQQIQKIQAEKVEVEKIVKESEAILRGHLANKKTISSHFKRKIEKIIKERKGHLKEIELLNEIVHTFDIIAINQSIQKMKKKISLTIDECQQSKMAMTFEELKVMEKNVQRSDLRIEGQLANIQNEIMEMKLKLKNKMC
jgi:hypothetical protein